MATARYNHTATLLNDGRVFVIGGGTALSELFDPKKDTFTSTAITGTTEVQTATVLKDGKVLLTGGEAAEIFEPISGTFTPTKGHMVSTRTAYTATLLNDGKVLGMWGSPAERTRRNRSGDGGAFRSCDRNFYADWQHAIRALRPHSDAASRWESACPGGIDTDIYSHR
jgi:hypothetical protein